MTDIQKLKSLAEAVTAGEWYEPGDLRFKDRKTGDLHVLYHDDEFYIAAANPTAVLELFAEIGRLKAGALEDLRLRTDLMEQFNQLKAENEELRKDAERYRWIRSRHNDLDSDIAVESDSEGLLESIYEVSPDVMDLDAAVDEALRRG